MISPKEFTTVAVNPLPDAISITSAEYRTSKQRLIINASDSVISPNVALTLQPYVCSGGTAACPGNGSTPVAGVYDPCAGVGCTFTNNGGGLYILDVVGAPRPVCNTVGETTYATPCTATPLDVKSNLNGNSGPFGLTRIRQ